MSREDDGYTSPTSKRGREDDDTSTSSTSSSSAGPLSGTGVSGARASGAPASGASASGASASGAPASGAPASGASVSGASASGASASGSDNGGGPTKRVRTDLKAATTQGTAVKAGLVAAQEKLAETAGNMNALMEQLQLSEDHMQDVDQALYETRQMRKKLAGVEEMVKDLESKLASKNEEIAKLEHGLVVAKDAPSPDQVEANEAQEEKAQEEKDRLLAEHDREKDLLRAELENEKACLQAELDKAKAEVVPLTRESLDSHAEALESAGAEIGHITQRLEHLEAMRTNFVKLYSALVFQTSQIVKPLHDIMVPLEALQGAFGGFFTAFHGRFYDALKKMHADPMPYEPETGYSGDAAKAKLMQAFAHEGKTNEMVEQAVNEADDELERLAEKNDAMQLDDAEALRVNAGARRLEALRLDAPRDKARQDKQRQPEEDEEKDDDESAHTDYAWQSVENVPAGAKVPKSGKRPIKDARKEKDNMLNNLAAFNSGTAAVRSDFVDRYLEGVKCSPMNKDKNVGQAEKVRQAHAFRLLYVSRDQRCDLAQLGADFALRFMGEKPTVKDALWTEIKTAVNAFGERLRRARKDETSAYHAARTEEGN
jgi:uncharacterized protein YjbI with pentapeptide repeats